MWKREVGLGNRLGSWLGRLEGRGEGSPKKHGAAAELETHVVKRGWFRKWVGELAQKT